MKLHVGHKCPEIERLMTAHPLLFKHAEPRCWSEVPIGWFSLVDKLCGDLEGLLDLKELQGVEVTQIKPKLGSLRFYCRLPNGLSEDRRVAFYLLVAQAEQRSNTICEVCGDAGHYHAFSTLCERHAQVNEPIACFRERQGVEAKSSDEKND